MKISYRFSNNSLIFNYPGDQFSIVDQEVSLLNFLSTIISLLLTKMRATENHWRPESWLDPTVEGLTRKNSRQS